MGMLAGQKKHMTREQIDKLIPNVEDLRKFTFGTGEKAMKVRLVANFSGYITAITENNSIVQGWAGEFSLGWN